jgi:hypothetical protein
MENTSLGGRYAPCCSLELMRRLRQIFLLVLVAVTTRNVQAQIVASGFIVVPEATTDVANSNLKVSGGALFGVPTGAQLYLAVHPRGLPSFRIAGGTMYYAHTWDVGAEVEIPKLRFLKIGLGYQGLTSSGAGRAELSEIINNELQSWDEDFTPIPADQFKFQLNGFYVQD